MKEWELSEIVLQLNKVEQVPGKLTAIDETMELSMENRKAVVVAMESMEKS